jgi:hypothetical protein
MTVIEVLADSELGEEVAARAADGAGAASPVGTGMLVPVFLAGGEVDGRRLPVTYRDAVEVVADAGVPLRAAQVCQTLGVGGEPRHREGMRGKLKRLVNRR